MSLGGPGRGAPRIEPENGRGVDGVERRSRAKEFDLLAFLAKYASAIASPRRDP